MTARSENQVQLGSGKDKPTVLTCSSDTEVLVNLLIRSRGPPSLETVLLVRVLLPSEGLEATVSETIHTRFTYETHRKSLNGQYRSTTPQHAQFIALLLPIKDRP